MYPQKTELLGRLSNRGRLYAGYAGIVLVLFLVAVAATFRPLTKHAKPNAPAATMEPTKVVTATTLQPLLFVRESLSEITQTS